MTSKPDVQWMRRGVYNGLGVGYTVVGQEICDIQKVGNVDDIDSTMDNIVVWLMINCMGDINYIHPCIKMVDLVHDTT